MPSAAIAYNNRDPARIAAALHPNVDTTTVSATMVAPPLGGLLIGVLGLAAGVRVGLAVTIGCCLVAVLLLAAFYREGPPRPHEPRRHEGDPPAAGP